jgi:putative transposase
MPNHYHMLVSEKIEDGIPLFMKKLNMGYARHFNEKYKRSGALWQGKYKKLLIERDGHFMYIPYYIHLNPLDLVMPSWRNGKVRKFSNALRYLESYRWSSHLDYIGLKNFPSVTQREFLSDVLGTKGQYLAEMRHIMTSELIASASDAIELGK